ncbi:MAG: NADH-quinone oxidoreductase subunit J family protein [Planctomycetaceae bacterium]
MAPCAVVLAAGDLGGRIGALSDRLRELWNQPFSGVLLHVGVILAAGAGGLYLMLPRGQTRDRRIERHLGALLATVSLVLLVTAPIAPDQATPRPGSDARAFWPLAGQSSVAGYTFYVLAFLSLASAVMMITSRNPVYSALWFALVLLANSGLYLLQGAEFLSAATIIVYAGAIVVTFLFVIMLAQPTGAANYDRVTREPLLSSLTGLILASALVGTLHHSGRAEFRGAQPAGALLPDPALIFAEAAAAETTLDSGPDRHVAGLGRALFVDQVVSVEVIGLLLLAAVVGAVLIAGHRLEHPTRN